MSNGRASDNHFEGKTPLRDAERTIRPYLKPILARILEGIGSVETFPYGVSLPRNLVENMDVRTFAYARIINVSGYFKKG